MRTWACFQESGQPELLVSINRGGERAVWTDGRGRGRGGAGGDWRACAPTQILEGDRRFDFVVRYQPQYRTTPEAIRNILLPTPDGNNVPLGQVADVSLQAGRVHDLPRKWAAVTFRSNSACAGATWPGRFRMCRRGWTDNVHLPEGYHLEWAGEYDSLQKEQRRLAVIIPISLAIILALLFTAFNSLRHALLVICDSAVWRDRGSAVAADHAHAVQHFRGGWDSRR